jgi:hypothetical protein
VSLGERRINVEVSAQGTRLEGLDAAVDVRTEAWDPNEG